MNSLHFLPKDIEDIIINYTEQLEITDKYKKCLDELENNNVKIKLCFKSKAYRFSRILNMKTSYIKSIF